MNAKETIKKIADALNIGAEETAKVEETKADDKVEETKVEATQETVEDTKVEATEDTKVEDAPEVVAEPAEVAEPVKEDTKEEDSKIQDLQKQVDELSKLLEVAVSKDIDTKEDIVPEIPETKVEPLTHSPESTPETNGKKIGGHGGDVLSRVYKYMS